MQGQRLQYGVCLKSDDQPPSAWRCLAWGWQVLTMPDTRPSVCNQYDTVLYCVILHCHLRDSLPTLPPSNSPSPTTCSLNPTTSHGLLAAALQIIRNIFYFILVHIRDDTDGVVEPKCHGLHDTAHFSPISCNRQSRDTSRFHVL
jgi:hypothetical protein